jgi:hypothetical protein
MIDYAVNKSREGYSNNSRPAYASARDCNYSGKCSHCGNMSSGGDSHLGKYASSSSGSIGEGVPVISGGYS